MFLGVASARHMPHKRAYAPMALDSLSLMASFSFPSELVKPAMLLQSSFSSLLGAVVSLELGHDRSFCKCIALYAIASLAYL